MFIAEGSMGKKILLPIHPGGFSSDVIVTLPNVRPGGGPVRPHYRYTNAKWHNLILGSLYAEFFWCENEWPAALCEAKKVEQKFFAIAFIYSDIILYDPYCLNLSTNLEYRERETEKMRK